jgi:acetoin utilization deacetylase AcuC-like enzyme
LVIAARVARIAGVEAVLILDLDAHCGGGTASLIEADPHIWHVDVSVNAYDSYQASTRVRLETVHKGADYLQAVRRALDEADRVRPRFGLCLYNAGMDPYEGCSTGGMSGVTREILAAREQMVFQWCKRQALPIAFVLAGGYIGPHLDKHGLVDLHRLTLSHAAQVSTPAASPVKR